MQKNKKIVFVGIGMVGASGLYSCIHRDLADEYVIIDLFEDFAEGQKLDFEDALVSINPCTKISVGDYDSCIDATIIVISAGRPQKPGETRLEMLQDNVKIIRDIGEKIKKSGFTGITLIVSNPVDIMTQVYQETTGFDTNKVISSGCHLDTQRLRRELKNRGVKNIEKYFMIGEHGDSSVGIFRNFDISEQDKTEIENVVHAKAEAIISRKKSTYYGIGACIGEISEAILEDSKKIFSVGKYLKGEFQESGIYASIPCIIGANGIEGDVEDIEISKGEQECFQKSCGILREEYLKLK